MAVNAAPPESKLQDMPGSLVSRIDRFALVIGAMKAGAIGLHERLAAHPGLARCRTKEPNFFGSDERWARGPEYYRSLWPDYDPDRHAHALEISTNYTKRPWHPDTATRIGTFARKFGAGFKLIYIVRDPVDRIEAHIAHNAARGRATAQHDARALEHALNFSRYAYQLEPFRGVFDPSEILVLDGDAFAADPSGTLSDCARFLGIDPKGFPPASSPIPSPSSARADTNRFRFTAEKRRTLQAALLDDMLLFRDRWGFDISKWGFSAGSSTGTGSAGIADVAAARVPKPASPSAAKTVPSPIVAPPPKAPQPSDYWKRRQKMMYYQYVLDIAGPLAAEARSLIDVGSHGTSMAEAFDWIPERVALDLREPYSSPAVTGIKADFFTFTPERRYDMALCLQVLEHVPDAKGFARKLLQIADRVLVSVPYLWPKNQVKFHCQDPVDEKKLADWFGRKPDYTIVVAEQFRDPAIARRLIAYFHVPGEKFDPKEYRDAKPRRGEA